MAITLTAKQQEANVLLGGTARHIALWGGSRSGKTFLLIRAMCMRALREPDSRHIIARLRKNHVVASVGRDTLPKVMKLCFPEYPYKMDHSEWFMTLKNGSQIWLGGLDDKQRVEKILGTEFSTIFLNECSQIPYGSVLMIRTRLAQKTNLVNRMYYDLNPSGTGHYCHRIFVEKVDPNTRLPLRDPNNYVSMVMNPGDNLANLAPDYISELQALPERQRARFLHGRFTADLDNALWTYENFRRVERVDPADCERIVVAVDPSGAGGPEDKRSDEIGIVVAARLKGKRYAILADRTLRGSPQQWARAVIGAYREFDADCVIVERNFGGAMVTHTIKTEGRGIPLLIREVVASRGKVVRAEPISALYARGDVDHVEYYRDSPKADFDKLEDQMVNMTTAGYMGEKSPDRCDAMIWALSSLAGPPKTGMIVGGGQAVGEF